MKKHITILKLVCTSFIFLSLFGCSSDQQAKEIMNQNETEFEIKEYSFVPRTTFVQYFSESYGEHNDFAKLIYDGINQKSTDQFSTVFNSREEADQFVSEFNSKTFLTTDYAIENGITLTDYQVNGTATFSILPTTFDNIELFNQFTDLAGQLVNQSVNDLNYLNHINQWMCENILYDTVGVSSNLSSDIFSGSSRAEGISNAVKILCNLNGIGCNVESGTVNGISTSWNKIHTTEGVYYLDCTMNVYYQNPEAYELSDKLWEDHLQ